MHLSIFSAYLQRDDATEECSIVISRQHIYSLFGNIRFNKMFGVCKVIGTRSKHFNSIIFWGFIGVMGVTVSITKLFFFLLSYRHYLGVLFTIPTTTYIVCMYTIFRKGFCDFSLEPILQKHFQLCYYRMFMCCFRHFLYFFHLRGSKLFIAFLTSSFLCGNKKKKINKLKGVYLVKLREMK